MFTELSGSEGHRVTAEPKRSWGDVCVLLWCPGEHPEVKCPSWGLSIPGTSHCPTPCCCQWHSCPLKHFLLLDIILALISEVLVSRTSWGRYSAFLSLCHPTGTQHGSGHLCGLANKPALPFLVVKKVIDGVVGKGAESGQKILSWDSSLYHRRYLVFFLKNFYL